MMTYESVSSVVAPVSVATAPPVVPVISATDAHAVVVLQEFLLKANYHDYQADKIYWQGVCDGFLCETEIGQYDEGDTPNFTQVISFVERNLSSTGYLRDCQSADRLGWSRPPYAHRVGFVLGWLSYWFERGQAPAAPVVAVSLWSEVHTLVCRLFPGARFVQ